MSGVFVGVVGPSGAGKDAVLRYAQRRLEPEGFLFPRRVITRMAGDAEDSEYVSVPRFAELEAAGAFALSWKAHHLQYGIPAETLEQVSAGAVVVGNLSRTVLGQLSTRFARARVVRITVAENVRRARIIARGREDYAALAARLNRPDPAPNFPVDLEIINSGTLNEAGEQLVGYLREAAN
ncbi:phosphonate metabolism protein/1,5-bisphosphokinase (PRPP-forming) PhnN [Nesterenkonia rhizosphaerae]|uniref:ribose 1,5-bisphosphate phosphokinase n=1 Tax=Nesterenkonia rhizosphaerae TaxID=1348272 RepID=A0ABP9FT35_9MICC